MFLFRSFGDFSDLISSITVAAAQRPSIATRLIIASHITVVMLSLVRDYFDLLSGRPSRQSQRESRASRRRVSSFSSRYLSRQNSREDENMTSVVAPFGRPPPSLPPSPAYHAHREKDVEFPSHFEASDPYLSPSRDQYSPRAEMVSEERHAITMTASMMTAFVPGAWASSMVP